APDRVVAFLALVGDSSDNVPGVKGVGEKTALELLQRFGDLDGVLAHAAEIPGKRAREAVSQYADLARLTRDLVPIRRDVPLALDLDALRLRPPDAARLAELFGELEFRSLIPKLEQLALPRAAPRPRAAPSPRPATPLQAEGRVVDDPEQLAELLARCRAASLVALATETTSLDPMRSALVGMALAIGPGSSWYLPFGHVAPDGELAGGVAPRNLPPLASEALRPLRALLEDPQVPKAAHHINFDWLVLRRAGVELGGVAYDSMLASFVLDPGRRSHALDELARERLGLTLPVYGELG